MAVVVIRAVDGSQVVVYREIGSHILIAMTAIADHCALALSFFRPAALPVLGARLNELSLMAAGPERTVNALRYLCTVAGLTCLATAVGTRTHMEQGQ